MFKKQQKRYNNEIYKKPEQYFPKKFKKAKKEKVKKQKQQKYNEIYKKPEQYNKFKKAKEEKAPSPFSFLHIYLYTFLEELYMFLETCLEKICKLKTQEDWNKAMRNCPKAIKYIPDWFNTRDMIEEFKDHPRIETYKQYKAQNAAMKNELLPIAWHPDRAFDWCLDEEQKSYIEEVYK